MAKAEGFSRIGQTIGFIGWLGALALASLAVYMMAVGNGFGERDLSGAAIYVVVGAIFLGGCKGLQWIIAGFTAEKS
jgi:hypothetical protein